MSTEIIVPKLGLTMKEAKLVKWLIDAGKTVAAEEAVAVIETDKVSFEIVAPANGMIHPVSVSDTMVLVAQVIGYVAADEVELAALQKEQPAGAEASSGQSKDTVEKTAVPATDTAAPKTGNRIIASPLARRMARENSLELADIVGTGPGGRIVEVDIQHALAAPPQTAPAPEVKASAVVESGMLTVAEEIPIQGIRKIISKNMHMSLQTQAQLTLQTDASAKGMQGLRKQINSILDSKETKISFNAIIVKAVAQALRKHPNINASVDEEVVKVWKIGRASCRERV